MDFIAGFPGGGRCTQLELTETLQNKCVVPQASALIGLFHSNT